MSNNNFHPPEPVLLPWSVLIPGKEGFIWFDRIKYRNFFLRMFLAFQNDGDLPIFFRMCEAPPTEELGDIIF